MTKAAQEETAANQLYITTTGFLTDEKTKLEDRNIVLLGTKGDKETKRQTTKGDRRLKKGGLDVVLKKISDAEAGCDYFTINFPSRTKNRQIEIDGLLKA